LKYALTGPRDVFMKRTFLGKKITFYNTWLSYKVLFHKQPNKEIRDEIDVAYTDKATPLARFSSLQGNAISFVLLSIAMAFAWFIFVFPFLGDSLSNWAWFVGMITLPFTLTGLYLYIRIIPAEYAFRRWEKTGQEVDKEEILSTMIYDIEYYLSFVVSVFISWLTITVLFM